MAACFTLNLIGRSLIGLITPLLPHLAVEFYSHHPKYQNAPNEAIRTPFKQLQIDNKFIGDIRHIEDIMEIVLKIRSIISEKRLKNGKLINMEKMVCNLFINWSISHSVSSKLSFKIRFLL